MRIAKDENLRPYIFDIIFSFGEYWNTRFKTLKYEFLVFWNRTLFKN